MALAENLGLVPQDPRDGSQPSVTPVLVDMWSLLELGLHTVHT